MSDKADALARSVSAHKNNDRSMELAKALGLSVMDYASIRILHEKVSSNPSWVNQRSPHGLMIDCIYLVAKRKGFKVTAHKIRKLTMSLFGVSTQPRPSVWKRNFGKEIEECL
tara:strand:+ start:4321 stop:4659 length:339 start_codon:yes stop_codon:yes gene_type:complete